MAQRKTFLLRLDPTTYEALQRWADSEMRSLNAHIEFLLRNSLREAGRLRPEDRTLPGREYRKGPERPEE